jgi:hypothetical protein
MKCPDCKIIRRAASSRPTRAPALADISPCPVRIWLLLGRFGLGQIGRIVCLVRLSLPRAYRQIV